jgi:hypothetical protein
VTRVASPTLNPQVTNGVLTLSGYATAPRWAKAVGPWAEKLAGDFLQIRLARQPRILGKPSLARHRTPLTQRNRSRPKGGVQKASVSLAQPSITARCKECGVVLAVRTRNYCDSCLLKGVEKAWTKAVETNARLHAIGEDKRSSPEARAKHRASAIRLNRLNQEWEAAQRQIPSPQVFREEILPALRKVSRQAIQAASGLSPSACKKILAGDLVPHPRHWEKLRRLT